MVLSKIESISLSVFYTDAQKSEQRCEENASHPFQTSFKVIVDEQ